MIIRDINDTIVAPATGSQATAIGIIRVSGPKAFDYLAPHFSAMKEVPPKRGLQFGILRNENGDMLDEVVVSFLSGPTFIYQAGYGGDQLPWLHLYH